MNLILFISSLKAGGAERVLTHLANHWAEKEWRITIITTWPIEKDFYSLNAQIKRISLNEGGSSSSAVEALKSNWNKLKKLRAHIKAKNPDAILAFLPDSGVLSLIASAFLGKKIIVSERNNATEQSLSLFWRILRRLTYPFANATVFVSNGVEKDFQWLPAEKRFVINNPVLYATPAPVEHAVSRSPQILSVGRLTRQKGYDLLIEAFAKIALDHPEWNLLVVGEGPDREKLEHYVQTLHLKDRIRFYGTHSDPRELMHESGLFVLSSRYEGFPNVLLEAMSTGMPAISFDCPYGPSDIIRHGRNGLLVPPENVTALANAMKDMINNSALREKLGSAAKDDSARFDINEIAGHWEKLIGML
jgi:glycosyltransferase involved in cell wall biosynthesis